MNLHQFIYTAIHINKGISLVFVHALLEYATQQQNILFSDFSLAFLFNTFDVQNNSTSSRAVLFSSFHAMTSSVIYYSTHARQNEIYLLK